MSHPHTDNSSSVLSSLHLHLFHFSYSPFLSFPCHKNLAQFLYALHLIIIILIWETTPPTQLSTPLFAFRTRFYFIFINLFQFETVHSSQLFIPLLCLPFFSSIYQFEIGHFSSLPWNHFLFLFFFAFKFKILVMLFYATLTFF